MALPPDYLSEKGIPKINLPVLMFYWIRKPG